MEDEYVEVATPGDMEVYRRLDAFADARLAPDPAAMRRIRAFVVAAASTRADELLAALPVAGASTSPARMREERSGRRLSRAATALLAASLTLSIGAGSAFAARPGGPLYDARLWVESVTLPGTGVARAEAQLDRLEARLAEVEAALQAGDAAAAEAALEAYADIVAELDAQVGADPSIGADVGDEVSRHLAVLDALVGRVPPQASDALQHARDRSDNALDHIGTGSGTTPPRGPGNNNGKGTNNGQGVPGEPGASNSRNDSGPGTGNGNGSTGPGNDNSGGNGPGTGNGEPGQPGSGAQRTPTPSPSPTPTAKPEKTPKPKPSKGSSRTPNPGAGQPASSPEPGNGSTNGPDADGSSDPVE